METNKEKTYDFTYYYGCIKKKKAGKFFLRLSMRIWEGYNMIVDERMVTFIHSLETENSQILETIEKEALDTYVPIIRKEMQSFLKVLLAIKKPKRILEVGTAIGFSAILMSEYAPEDCHITTIEKNEKRIPIARENFKRAGKEDKITLLEGDALEIMQSLEGSYDFIFMDAAKGQYIYYMPEAVRLLEKDGVFVSDNPTPIAPS